MEKNPAAQYVNTERLMKAIGETIESVLPEHVGFILLTFETGVEKGQANYMSSANREDCIKFLRETADRLEKNQVNSKIVDL